mgnify:FL=1
MSSADSLEDLSPPGQSADDIEDIEDEDPEESGILLKGPEVHIGGDDEYDEEESRAAPEPRQRSNEEEDARARARARAERNRLKKLAMQEMGAPKEPRSRQRRQKPERRQAQAPAREAAPPGPKPKRDYINQQDWQNGKNGRNRGPMTAKTFLIGFGVSVLGVGILAMLVLVTYDIYDKRFGTAESPEEVAVEDSKKSKLRVPKGLTDHFQGKTPEEEEVRDPLVPPSQQEEEMFEKSAISNLSDDGLRAIFGQLDLMKREIKQAQKRQERIEGAVEQIENMLDSVNEGRSRNKKRKGKKKASRNRR